MYKERQFLFASSWKFAKLYERALRTVGHKRALTQCEMDVLIFLYVNHPKNTSKDIAEFRSISKSLICKSVSSLVEKGLLISENDSIDARVLRLTLTREGEATAVELVENCEKLCRNLLWGISDTEMNFIYNVQNRLLENGRRFN